jgi:CelD/BcsL family acetyltransferase involved in cellulose biosynthesis
VTVRVAVVAREDALAPHRERWDALAAASGRPACTSAWSLAWWRHLRHPRSQLRVLLAWDGDALVGLGAFCAEQATPALARYRLLGAGVSPRLAPLAPAGREPEVAAAFAAALAEMRPRPSVVRFEGIEEDCSWPSRLASAWPGGRAAWIHRGERVAAPTVQLAGRTFDEWFAARSARFRMRMRQSRRRLERRGGRVRFATPATVSGDVEAFIRLHHARWSGRGGSGVLTPAVERLVREAVPELLRAGHARMVVVEAGEAIISSQVFLAAGGEVTWWLGGFDEAWAYYQPSHLALLDAVADAAARGDRRFDLGSGGQRYKYSFADGEDTLSWDQLVPPGARAIVRRAQLVLGERRRRLAPAGRPREGAPA